MKPFIAALVVAAGLMATAMPTEAKAQGVYIGPGGVRIGGPAYRGGYNRGYYGRPYGYGYRPYVRYGYRGLGVYPYTSGYRYGFYGRRW